MNEEKQTNNISGINTHTHNGINSQKIKVYNIVPSLIMTPTQLTNYLSKNSIEGEEFNVFEGTNYYKYIRINKLWKKITLSS